MFSILDIDFRNEAPLVKLQTREPWKYICSDLEYMEISKYYVILLKSKDVPYNNNLYVLDVAILAVHDGIFI